jgi:hypothetical protein
LRFRVKDNEETDSTRLQVVLKSASSSSIALGGNFIGKATIDASGIIGELDKLRADANSEGRPQLLFHPCR